jgi:hypothetical protein
VTIEDKFECVDDAPRIADLMDYFAAPLLEVMDFEDESTWLRHRGSTATDYPAVCEGTMR